LLDKSDAERRTVGQRKCDWAYLAYSNTLPQAITVPIQT
jgi:hypothetical protein